jgi:hypothetical protein
LYNDVPDVETFAHPINPLLLISQIVPPVKYSKTEGGIWYNANISLDIELQHGSKITCKLDVKVGVAVGLIVLVTVLVTVTDGVTDGVLVGVLVFVGVTLDVFVGVL